jgi:cyclohexyl-isocyanide hydratase
LEGEEIARSIQLQIEYDPAPPFNSGSPKTASAATVHAIRDRLKTLNQQRHEMAQRVGQKLGTAPSA